MKTEVQSSKNGIEFGYTSPRFKSINTRFTLSGAYFKTQLRNSVPVVETPSASIGADGFPYYGIYQNDDGYVNSNMNYNLFIDTYLPNLDLTISASFQGSVFDHQRKDQRIAEPIFIMESMELYILLLKQIKQTLINNGW